MLQFHPQSTPRSKYVVAVEDGVPQRHETLTSVLVPLLDDTILPSCRSVLQCSTLVVADALVRVYDPKDGKEALPAHYDESSFASVIVPLNPRDCKGGLYLQSGCAPASRRSVPFDTAGDAVLHRFDVMHGVHVTQGVRYSLVVWFAETKAALETGTVPWVATASRTSTHAAYLHGTNAKHGQFGVPEDKDGALAEYQWAAERGHAISQYALAMWWLRKRDTVDEASVEATNAQVVRWLERAARHGLLEAHHELGTAYKQGYFGLQRDHGKAREQYQCAADQGYLQSMEILADPLRWIIWD